MQLDTTMSGGIEAPDLDEPAAASSGQAGVIFVLENAQLETAKVGKNYELLNCDDHANFLRRHGKDPALYRPDICHQVGGRRAECALSTGQGGGCRVHLSSAVLCVILSHTCHGSKWDGMQLLEHLP